MSVSNGSHSHGGSHAAAHQPTVRQYFLSTKSACDASSSSSSSKCAPIKPVPSSLPFVLPTDPPASSVPSSACISSLGSLGSSASVSSVRTRRSKRDRHSDTHEGTECDGSTTDGQTRMTDESSMASSCTASVDSYIRLPARTLLYQLHVLRSDEYLFLRGVDGGGAGVDMQVKTQAQMDEEENRQRAAAEAAAKPSDSEECKDERYACLPIWDQLNENEEEKAAAAARAAAAAAAAAQLEPLSPDPPSSPHPLFPDCMEWVSLYLSPTAAHDAFLRAKGRLREVGVLGVKERIIELQLNQSVFIAVVEEEQQQQWEEQARKRRQQLMRMIEQNLANAAIYRAALAAAAQEDGSTEDASSVAESSTAASSSIAASPSPLPSLYTPPRIPRLLRDLLDEEADESAIEGFCIGRLASEDDDPVDGSDYCAVNGEVVLSGWTCNYAMRVLDDDKKGKLNQQLLTDLFGRMEMSKQIAKTVQKQQQLYDAQMEDEAEPVTSVANGASASSCSLTAPASSSSGLQLAPSSFSASLRAASEQMFASATAGALVSSPV